MADEEEKYIDIHGFKVKVDDKNSSTLKNAVRHLKDKLDKDEVKIYFKAAERDLINHKAHFEVRDHEKHTDRDVTLIHNKDGSYTLQKRHRGIF
jgi:adenylate cyclase class IV